MPVASANGVDIAYDWHGPDEGPVMLLIMGLGIPSSAWPPGLVECLSRSGYRVLTFDNRDVGQSQILDEAKMPPLAAQLLRYMLGMPVRAPYRLDDMAEDAVALLDALNLPSAHLVGASMGGMIAQIVATKYPQRTLSLTSIMSTTNARRLPRPQRSVKRYVLRHPRGKTQEELRRYHDGFWPLIGSPAFPRADGELSEFLDRLFARGMSPSGATRQLLAILAQKDRTAALEALRLPTLVVHGDADPLVPVEHGYATAAAVRDADMLVLEGMGHDLPEPLIPRICDAVVAQARVCDAGASIPG